MQCCQRTKKTLLNRKLNLHIMFGLMTNVDKNLVEIVCLKENTKDFIEL